MAADPDAPKPPPYGLKPAPCYGQVRWLTNYFGTLLIRIQTWLKLWLLAAAFEADPENPPPYGLPKPPPPWLKVWDEAPALAAVT